MRSLLIAGLMAFAMAACTIGTPQPQFAPQAAAGSTVKVIAGQGHGSGVHIGGGYIITAAHVTAGATADLPIKADDGTMHSATVLWENKGTDIALLKLNGTPKIAASKLACAEPPAGAELKASGSPGSLEFISTYGRVSGAARKHGPWSSVVVFDGTVAPGMSGGGVFNDRGEVVGITVGLMVVPAGFSASLLPVSYIVPASAVCGLLARV